jgi:lysophospholipase L1-like esterase
MKYTRFRRIFAGILIVVAATTVALAEGVAPGIPAATPAPRPEAEWRQRDINARVKQGHVDLIFIGDSITHSWEGGGKDVWKKYYGHRNAVNMGIACDRTQHVLWRLDRGHLDGISPKLAVVMIGTNNTYECGPAEIAAGIKAIVEKLRAKVPTIKVLVLGIFPRGPNKEDRHRQIIVETNKIIEKLADGRNVFYLDISPSFLAADGTMKKELVGTDLVHLTPAGYAIWAESIEPMVAKLMGERD